MKRLYIVTGASGHLGNTIIRILKRTGKTVRGLILPSEKKEDSPLVSYIRGDITKKDSLEALFADTQEKEIIVIHTAGVVDISDQLSDTLYDVNVNGTKNIIDLCMEYRVRRLVYVSSVHAIPEKDHLQVLKETDTFSPEEVTGGYAKTKAEATRIVLDSVKEGLDAVVVHPSGILGPYDKSGNHLVQMVSDYVEGRLPACVNGGYDFVDVRDVAMGCLSAAEKGKAGDCYILSNRHYEIKDLLKMIKSINGGKTLFTLPMWSAKAAAPMISWYAKCRKRRPLYTKYSLYTLASNDRFSHDKATIELNYKPRDMYRTLADTIVWMRRSSSLAGRVR